MSKTTLAPPTAWPRDHRRLGRRAKPVRSHATRHLRRPWSSSLKLTVERAMSARSDTGAFDEIAQRYESYLHHRALHLTGNAASAKDLVQDTLVRALTHFADFRQGTNARAWLAQILTRLFLDQLKHDQVVSNAQSELSALEQNDHEPTVFAISSPELWAAVDKLEPELREIIILRYQEQKSYQRIATQLDLPAGTVGTRLFRAHNSLRALLKKAFP